MGPLASQSAPPTPRLTTADEGDRPRVRNPWLPILIVTPALGVAVVAVAYAGARLSRPWADVAYWTGLLIIVLPIALRLIGAGAGRRERLYLVMLLGLALFAVTVLLSPGQFALHDALGAYRSIKDILRSGRLYIPNPIDAAYSSYPGILVATGALSHLSGLPIVACGWIVVGVAKMMLTGGLFLFVERIFRSSRIAGIAVLLYMTNPNFMFFDSQVAYESLALGLGAVVLWVAGRAADETAGRWRDVVAAAVLDGALVLTHHLTAYAVAAMMLIWAVLSLITRPRQRDTRRVIFMAVVALAMTGAYAVFAFKATQSDIGGSIVGSINGLIDVVRGTASGKTPFTSAPGYGNPLLEQLVGEASVGLLMAGWPLGLYAGWRQRRQGLAVPILGVVACLYPASLALRLTAAGSETSNRTSEFVFVGLGTMLALAFILLMGRRVDRRGWGGRALCLLATIYVGVVFVGGITVGAARYDLVPGPYEVAADARSVDVEGVDAAKWAARWIPGDGNFLADTTDSELVTAYTRLDPQSGTAAGVPVGELFVSPSYGAFERRMITFSKLRYLVVDRRDGTALPHSGHYFDGGDPQAYSAPIAIQAREKFDSVKCIDRVFASGHIVVYDTGRVLRGCR